MYPNMDEQRFIHPNVNRWIENNVDRQTAAVYRQEICLLLQELWGPLTNYDFSDLRAGYPLPNRKFPHTLYIYPTSERRKVAFQIVGDAIVEGRCTRKVSREYRERELNLSFEGWMVLSFIRENLEIDLTNLRQRLAQRLLKY